MMQLRRKFPKQMDGWDRNGSFCLYFSAGCRWFLALKLKCKNSPEPWLVWLGRLSASLQTDRSPTRFPVGAHAWVEGQVPGGVCERQLIDVSLTH